MRTRRKQLDLTQAELGRRAACSEATIRKIEADERKPSRQLAELLARALLIPPINTQRILTVTRGTYLEEPNYQTTEVMPTNNNLPALLTSTINRVRDQTALIGLLKDQLVHLVTIIGPPGIGKTRLSIHCGNEVLADFPDGVWFVDLSEISDPRFLISSIAHSLTSFDLPPSPDLNQLVRGLRNRQLLLILDNFEQIAEEGAIDVARMLKNCPHIKILVTSRLPLHIYGENEYPLAPLTIPPPDAPRTQAGLKNYESVQLLVARIQLYKPGFTIIAENADAIIQICNLLEGIPLALELAAASLRNHTPQEMVSLLTGRAWISQIGTPARDLPMRQRTLENVIEWSYRLLNDDEMIFYSKLGVLSGWFDAKAAAAVCGTNEPQTLTRLTTLHDHSLLLQENQAGRSHWRMLEIIHAHAYSKLAQPDEIELLRAQYFLKKVSELKPGSSRSAAGLFFLEKSHQFAWSPGMGDPDQKCRPGIPAYHTTGGTWNSFGFLDEGLAFCQQLALQSDSFEPVKRGKLAQTASDLAWQQHDFDTAQEFARQSVELGKENGLMQEYPVYLNRLGRIFIEQGKLESAKEVLNEAFERASMDDAMLNPGVPLAQMGEIALFEGRLDEARAILEQALPFVEKDEAIFFALTTTDLAEVALETGNFDQSLQWLTKSFEPAKNHIRRLIVLLCSLAGYLALSPEGNAKKAASFYGAIKALSDRTGILLANFYLNLNEQRLQKITSLLSDSECKAAIEDGRRWNKETALGYAEEILGRLNGNSA